MSANAKVWAAAGAEAELAVGAEAELVAGPKAEPAAAERAYLATKDLILSGRLAAGTLLSEGEIAAQLQLSRTPVREAFLRLETEDLLRLIPKRGAIVVPASPTEARDVLDVRVALETSAVERLAARDDIAEVLAIFEALLTEQGAAARDRDVELFAELDQLFHAAIVTAGDNPIATRFYASLADRQRRMTIGAVGLKPQRLPELRTQHRKLVGFIAAGDPAGFRMSLVTHLHSTHGLRASR